MEVVFKFLRELAESLPDESIPLVFKGKQPLKEATKYFGEVKESKLISLAEGIGLKTSAIADLSGKIEIVTGLVPYALVEVPAKNIEPKEISKKIGEFDIAHDFHTLLFMTRPRINADYAQEKGYDGSGVKIAIIDTGVDDRHPDLDVTKKLTVIMREPPDDLQGHGSHVGGIAAGRGKIRNELRGIAPKAELISIKVLDSRGYGSSIGVAKGIELAVDAGADVMNLSLGGPGGPRSPEYAAAEAAWRLGHVVVVAAGNEGEYGWATVGSPGCAPSVITVGSVNKTNDDVADYSSKGPVPEKIVKPDILAPGGNLAFYCDEKRRVVSTMSTLARWRCTHDTYYVEAIGTSMASPHIAGAAAIIVGVLRKQGFDYSGREFCDTVKWALLSSAKPISGYSVWEQGAGLVDLKGAIEKASKVKRPQKYEIPYEKPPVPHPRSCGRIYANILPGEAVPLIASFSARVPLSSIGRVAGLALSLYRAKRSAVAHDILNMEVSILKMKTEFAELREELTVRGEPIEELSDIIKILKISVS